MISNCTQVNGNISAANFISGGEVHLGSYAETSALTAGLLSAAPEPDTWMLSILGFGAIGLTCRGKPKLAEVAQV